MNEIQKYFTLWNGTTNVTTKLGFSAIIDGNNKTLLSPMISQTAGNESMFPFCLGMVIKDLNISGGEVDSKKKWKLYFESCHGDLSLTT